MKLIEKSLVTISGETLHWHAVQDVFVDVLSGFCQITYGSWATQSGAKNKISPVRTKCMDVYFGAWNPDMLMSANEFLVSDGELKGGTVVMLQEETPQVLPPPVTEQPSLPDGFVFDVGAMP